MSNTESNKNTIRAFIEALGRIDAERFLSFLADDVHFETTGQHQGAGIKTKEQVAKELPPMQELLPDGIKFTEVSMHAEGDWVCAEFRGEAKTVKGEDYNNQYAHFYKIREGKIVLFRDYMDSVLAEKILVPFFIAYGATAEARERENAGA